MKKNDKVNDHRTQFFIILNLEHRKKIDSLEEKIDEQTSTLSQNKRTSQNLRRHAQDIKMEKESFSRELFYI